MQVSIRSNGWTPLLAITVALATPAVAAAADQTRDFPVKPVRVMVGSTPGGAADTTVRTIALALTDLWGNTALVDNRAGAGGGIAR